MCSAWWFDITTVASASTSWQCCCCAHCSVHVFCLFACCCSCWCILSCCCSVVNFFKLFNEQCLILFFFPPINCPLNLFFGQGWWGPGAGDVFLLAVLPDEWEGFKGWSGLLCPSEVDLFACYASFWVVWIHCPCMPSSTPHPRRWCLCSYPWKSPRICSLWCLVEDGGELLECIVVVEIGLHIWWYCCLKLV